jgi:hypothetical protein
LAIVSLVSALLGLVCGLGCIVAVITGHLARGEFKRDPTLGGKGLALAGLIIGYVEIALIAIFLALYFTIIGVAVHQGMKNATFTPTLQDSGTNSSDSNSTPTTPDADTNSASTNGAPATPDTDTNSPSTNSPTATPSQ